MSQPHPNQTDHDILTELKTEFKIFTDQYRLDMTELKNGYTRSLADHELRIQKIEKIMDVTQPELRVKELSEIQRQMNSFIQTANVFRILGGIIGGGVMFLLVQLPNWFRLFTGK